jgi:hypothetical protein
MRRNVAPILRAAGIYSFAAVQPCNLGGQTFATSWPHKPIPRSEVRATGCRDVLQFWLSGLVGEKIVKQAHRLAIFKWRWTARELILYARLSARTELKAELFIFRIDRSALNSRRR